ncbi:hypothetical protein ACFL13_00725 [Patescibacteria group bacterium]
MPKLINIFIYGSYVLGTYYLIRILHLSFITEVPISVFKDLDIFAQYMFLSYLVAFILFLTKRHEKS